MARTTRVSSIAGSLGFRICTWTIDTRDWQYVNGSRRSTSSIRYIVRNSPWSAKASGVVLGHLNTNYPNAISGIIYDLHQQGLLFCRNRGPVGRTMPFPALAPSRLDPSGSPVRKVRARRLVRAASKLAGRAQRRSWPTRRNRDGAAISSRTLVILSQIVELETVLPVCRRHRHTNCRANHRPHRLRP